MLSTFVYKQVRLFLRSIVLINIYLFYTQWWRIRLGHPDFSIFYTAAKILQMGRGADLYNDALQESVQRSFSHAVDVRGSILPYNHPAFEALLFRPLAHFSYFTAFRIYLVFNILLVAAIALVVRRYLPELGRLSKSMWLLIGFAFPPLVLSLIQGQDTPWIVLCYCLAFGAWERNAEAEMGVWLGLGLCKFHLVVPFLLAPLVQRRWRMLASFSAVALVLAAISVWIVGWKSLHEYPEYALWTEHVAKFHWNVQHYNAPNLRGTVLSSLPERFWPVGEKIVPVVSLGLLGFGVYLWQRAGQGSDARALAFSVNLIIAHLVSYHSWFQDMSLLFLPVLLLLDVTLRRPDVSRADLRFVWIVTGIFFYMPLYELLVSKEHLHLMTWLVLVLLGATVALLRREVRDAEPTPVLA
jgi:hypothetical protein